MVQRSRKLGPSIAPAIYDPTTGMLHIGEGHTGHFAISRGPALANVPTAQLSGIVIMQRGGTTYFVQKSGWFNRSLTAAEEGAIGQALQAEFGLPAVYGTPPGLGSIIMPGGAIPGTP
jgi:hypothetical protein